MTRGQSDSFILLGDGSADHEGKERAGRLNEHSHHALGRNVPKKSVSRTLLELREKAKQEPKHRFRSLYREINLPMLYESFRGLNRRSQRKSYNWTTFDQMWKTLGVPNPSIVEKPYCKHHQWTLSYS